MMKATNRLISGVLVAHSLVGIAGAKSIEGSRPNIILVMTDDQGMGDLACMGNPILKTPNLDRFYERSTHFTDFQVSPTCAPTRSAMMSGRAPFKNGVTHTIMQRERMALDTFTLPQALKTAGYATGLFGKWHLGDEAEYRPGSRGFDEVLMHGAGGIGQTGLGDFYANKKNCYFDHTLLIFMTDNGMSMRAIKKNGKPVQKYNAGLRAGKNSPHEGGTHVPAFWYWKGVLGEGVDVNALTAHFDLYKTFCELAGAKFPKRMQALDGRSLLPLLIDPNADWADRELFIHCGRWPTGKRDAYKVKNCAVRTARWRLVNNRELYDISADPGETTDVSGSHPEVVERMRKSYDAWWRSVTPLMVNEGLPKAKNKPLPDLYTKQLETQGIPEWAPEPL